MFFLDMAYGIPEDTRYLARVWVRPHLRGEGIGRALIRCAELFAADSGATRLFAACVPTTAPCAACLRSSGGVTRCASITVARVRRCCFGFAPTANRREAPGRCPPPLGSSRRTQRRAVRALPHAARSLRDSPGEMSTRTRPLHRDVRRAFKVAYEAYVLNGILKPRRVQRHLFFWARFVLRKQRPTIIGITGSVGKSTATQRVAAVLTHPDAKAVIGKVRRTTNNMNNHDGLPLVVLGFDDFIKGPLNIVWLLLRLPFRALRLALSRGYPRLLVLEYGSDRVGYIDRMVELAPPAIAIITAIGPAHLEGMGSMDGVVQEKASLLRGHPAPRLVILGEDHDWIESLAACARSPLVRIPGRGINWRSASPSRCVRTWACPPRSRKGRTNAGT